jgi:uncharacterized protein YbjT (DUF2867 family)
VRSSHVFGLGGLWFTAVVQGALEHPPVAIGGEDPIAPVFADDVAAVLAAIEERPGDLGGTWGLEGPNVLTPAALTGMLAAGDAHDPERLELSADPGARLEGLLDVALTGSAVRHVLDPSRADAPDAAAAFSVVRTPLAEGLRRTLLRVAEGVSDGDRSSEDVAN